MRACPPTFRRARACRLTPHRISPSDTPPEQRPAEAPTTSRTDRVLWQPAVSPAWRPQAEETAHDSARDCDVRIVTDPGVYDTDAVWVRPVDGGNGYLAPCNDLGPTPTT